MGFREAEAYVRIFYCGGFVCGFVVALYLLGRRSGFSGYVLGVFAFFGSFRRFVRIRWVRSFVYSVLLRFSVDFSVRF